MKRQSVVLFLVAALSLSTAPAWAKKRGDEKPPAGPAAGPGAGHKEEPSFEEATKDFRKIPGLFDVYEKDGKYLMALKPAQLDTQFMVSVTRETGLGQLNLLAVQVLGETPVRFHQVGKRIQMLLVNTRFAALDDPEARRAVEKSFSDSLQGAAKIESLPDPDSKAILIDMAPMFLTYDVEGVGVQLNAAFQTPYGIDKENSYIRQVKGFPENVELEARLHFAGSRPAGFVNLADARSLFISYRYSLSQVPAATGFMPRIADDRLGHFISLYADYSDDHRETPFVRYVTRWNLEKEEPYAAMSKPKQPIVYWLENSIPKKYRKPMADGILMWNAAFEKIGFKDAIVVKQQPDDADWDPADIRYATVRWFVATDTAFAIGPSRINPMTGQIYDADISWSESLISGVHRQYEELADPVKTLQQVFDAAAAVPGQAANPRFACNLASGAAQQLSFGLELLDARGIAPGSAEQDAFVDGFVTYVMAHEMGHTLGFRHNFRASVLTPVSELQDAARTSQHGLVGSVMDYVPPNLAARGKKQGQYYQTTLGPYDYWAVEYAYKPIPGAKKPEDELPELAKIAERVAQPGNSYGTDEDTTDPVTNVWDMGSDPVAFFSERLDLVHELWQEIPSRLSRDGEGYQVMRRAFGRGLGQVALSVINVTKTIGGLNTFRDHVGDPSGRLPMQPVSAATQRAALDFLKNNLFSSTAFDVPPDLLNKLAITRWYDFTGAIFGVPRLEFPLHDSVLLLQDQTLNALYSPVKLDRLVDLEMQFPAGQKPFTMAEMFGELQKTIWSETYAAGAPRIDSFRRGLQRTHLNRLVGLLLRPQPGVPEDAATLARGNLVELRERIDAVRGQTADAATRAHLDETRSRIEAALSAHMLRITS